MWKRSQQHIITLATICVIKMLSRWTARLKCGYPVYPFSFWSRILLLCLARLVISIGGKINVIISWEWIMRGLPRDRLITQSIFSVVVQIEWQRKADRKTITTNEYWNNWLRYTGLMLPTCKPTKLIYVIRLNVTSREFFLEKGHSAWRTEYFMRNETLLFVLLSYHVKNVV